MTVGKHDISYENDICDSLKKFIKVQVHVVQLLYEQVAKWIANTCLTKEIRPEAFGCPVFNIVLK